MRIKATLIMAAFSCLASLVQAFEPGHEQICTPSADGQTFECRDKTTGIAEALPASPVKSEADAVSKVPVKPAAAAVSEVAAPAATKPSTESTLASPSTSEASKLPNYLMQSPSPTERPRLTETAPAVAKQAKSIEPRTGEGQSVKAAPASAAIPAEVKASTIETAAPARSQVVEQAGAERLQASDSAPEPAMPTSTPSGKQATRSPSPTQVSAPPPPSPASALAVPHDLPGAGAFLGLPASHYTLVLASVRDPSALENLVDSLAALSAQLYLLKLGMPDGDWYSLCWSDFADLDAARAARASLPADAPISSGWPRRIGLLQKEIAR